MLAAVLALASCSGNAPDADGVKVALTKFFEASRAGANYEIGGIENVKCSKNKKDDNIGCGFDLTITDKDAQITETLSAGDTFTPDGSLVWDPEYPLQFEELIAARKLLRDDPQFKGLTFQKVDPSCSKSEKGPGQFCLVTLKLSEGSVSDIYAAITGNLARTDASWTLTVDPATLNGGWERGRLELQFSDNRLIVRDSGGQSLFDTRPDGDGALLMQKPAEGTMSGTITQPAGPIARCTYQLKSAIKLTITSCRYSGLEGDFYKRTSY